MALKSFGPDDWERVDQELDRLIDLSADERESALQELAKQEAKLAAGLRHIIENSDSPLDRPAIEAMAELIDADTGQPQDPALGTQIGPFRLVKRLGVGGMGIVYLADRNDGHFRQQVALKVVREGARDPASQRRFLAERQILAELDHPNIARLIDGGVSDDGRPYLAMEYVSGVPLDIYCERNDLSVRQRLTLFLDVCAAVDTAHRSLVVHRDLKPNNIFVDDQGTVKVLDFGIAKWLDEERAEEFGSLTMGDAAPLTPDCSAPEQLQGGPITTATDVYALGVLLFRILAEQAPFDLSEMAITERIRCLTQDEAPLSSEVAKLDRRRELRGDLDQIVAKAMRKNPARRYASARELADDLTRYLSGLPVLATPNSTAYRVGKFVRRNAVVVVVASLAILALIGGLIGTTWQAQLAKQERVAAEKQAARAERISESLVRIFEDSNPYSGAGRVPTALDILDTNVERMRLEFADDPALQADLLLMMARAYKGLGHMAPVEDLFLTAEAVRDSIYGAGSLESAKIRLQRVSLLRRQGDLAAARELMLDVVKAYERWTDPISYDRLAVDEASASLAHLSGDLAAADSLSLRVLEICDQLPEVNRATQATSYTHRAAVLGSLGRTVEASDHYRRAIEIFAGLPNERHNLAGTLGNFAILLQSMGRLDEAAERQRESIALTREIGMVSGDVLANHLNTYGVILNDLGRYQESIPILREAAAMNEEAGGKSGIRWLAVAMTLGTALTYNGEYDEAVAWLDDAVAGMENLVGTEHLYYGVALSYRGILDRRAGWALPARERLEESLGLLHPHLPARARNTVVVLTELGELALAEERGDQARKYLLEALDIAKDELDSRDSFRALAACGLAEVLRREGQKAEAAILLNEAVEVLSIRRGTADAWTHLAMTRLAQAER